MNSAMKTRSVQSKDFKVGYVDDHVAWPGVTKAGGCKNFAECTAIPRRGMEEYYEGSSYDPERHIWRDGCNLVKDTYAWGLGGFGMAGDGEWGMPNFDTRGKTKSTAPLHLDYFWMGTVKKAGDDASPMDASFSAGPASNQVTIKGPPGNDARVRKHRGDGSAFSDALFGSFFWAVAAQADNFSLVMGCLAQNGTRSASCV